MSPGPTAYAAGPPVDLSGPEAAREAARELSRGVYGNSLGSLREAGRHALVSAWERVLAGAHGHAGPVGVLMAAVLVAAIVVLVGGLARFGSPRRNIRARADLMDPGTPLSAAHLRARAAAAAAAGNWTAAVLAGFRAVAGEIVEGGLVAAVPGLTATELVEAVAPVLPGAAASLRAAATVFGAVSYGYSEAGPDDVATVTAADAGVLRALGSRVLGSRVPADGGRPAAAVDVR